MPHAIMYGSYIPRGVIFKFQHGEYNSVQLLSLNPLLLLLNILKMLEQCER